VHLSCPFVANLRRPLKPESNNWSTFRPLLPESLQGCQVSPTLMGIHIPEMGSWNTVRSRDMNPNSISSDQKQEKKKKKTQEIKKNG
jgi:hypothetical protein